ncbi:O-antigen ligase family protein [Microbacterium sp. NPDC058345]|uniref:O-antigen ligase family protein n=1 Tax=Microbacterium sp. NPDC058345 TaxID=3346455 RepID=UPI00365F7412
MLLSRLAALLLVLSVSIGQRVHWLVDGNPINVFAIAFVAVAAILWARDSFVLHPAKQYRAVALNTVGPLLALLIALPFFGVMTGWYNVTILYGWMVVAVPLAILSLGRAARLHGLRLDRVAFVLILAHGLYGLGQTLVRLGVVSESVWPAQQWDIAAQAAINEAYVVVGRSTGLFLNANAFGFWSCGAVLVGAVMLVGWRRSLSVTLGIVGILGSQSRTAWVCLAMLLVILGFVMLRHARVGLRVLFAVVSGAPIALVTWMSGGFANLFETSLVERLVSGVGVLSVGVEADTNLAARVDSWSAAVEFAGQYPLGTLGPPQALFGYSLDNQFVSFFLQGGVLLVGAYVLALFSPIVLARRGVPRAGALGVAAALFALTSFTMLPFESSASAVFWLLAGAAFSTTPDAQTDRHTAAPSNGGVLSANAPAAGRSGTRKGLHAT